MPADRRRPFILPYEPDYAEHRNAEKRQRDTRAWLQRREAALAGHALPPRVANVDEIGIHVPRKKRNE